MPRIHGIEELIAQAPTFAGLGPDQLRLIAGCAVNEHVSAGGTVAREGDPADRFFLVRAGSVALELHAPGRGELTLQTLHAGEVLGWAWLFAPYRWPHDARAVQDCQLTAFDGACLRGKCRADHELGYALMGRFAAILAQTLQATQMQLLDVYGRAHGH
jgi:CRP/FNR family transcriptional regulator, cyclic AMP receptor protein